jgi:hypothetical protein
MPELRVNCGTLPQRQKDRIPENPMYYSLFLRVEFDAPVTSRLQVLEFQVVDRRSLWCAGVHLSELI